MAAERAVVERMERMEARIQHVTESVLVLGNRVSDIDGKVGDINDFQETFTAQMMGLKSDLTEEKKTLVDNLNEEFDKHKAALNAVT